MVAVFYFLYAIMIVPCLYSLLDPHLVADNAEGVSLKYINMFLYGVEKVIRIIC